MDPADLSRLLPVLIDEIRRLKDLHVLAGVTELPVRDTVVREELALLRAEFAQIIAASGNQAPARAPATEAAEDTKPPAVFGQTGHPPWRPPSSGNELSFYPRQI